MLIDIELVVNVVKVVRVSNVVKVVRLTIVTEPVLLAVNVVNDVTFALLLAVTGPMADVIIVGTVNVVVNVPLTVSVTLTVLVTLAVRADVVKDRREPVLSIDGPVPIGPVPVGPTGPMTVELPYGGNGVLEAPIGSPMLPLEPPVVRTVDVTMTIVVLLGSALEGSVGKVPPVDPIEIVVEFPKGADSVSEQLN